MITGCAVTRGNSEDPVGKEQGGREQKTGKKMEGEKGQNTGRAAERCEMF